ncbi:cytochrome P450 [Nocardia carnea]|uniref:cytochrome P450 n=1 Tax=Nocardia carnea TaxID=37328 RepID=UPI003D780BE4
MTEPLVDSAADVSSGIAAFPMARASGCPFDPPPALRELQAEGAFAKVRLWDGSTPWVVTRHADQRALLSDPRISADPTQSGFPYWDSAQCTRGKEAQSRIPLFEMDDPEHARLRRMVSAHLTAKRVEALRPAIQRIADTLIDAMLEGPKPVDLVEAFALPLPSLVICELLGVPYDDHEFFQENSVIFGTRGAPPEATAAARDKLTDYLDGLIGDKLADPGNDMLSRVAVERVATGELPRADLAQLAWILLHAGHETTTNMIALGTLALLEHPDQLAQLRGTDDSKLIAGAVEELLRYLHINQVGRRRVATEDIEHDGHLIRAGDGLVFALDVGDRDESVFPDPDRLDVHRDARQHVAFSFGVHQCLGQQLARVELQVIYSTLYRRIPGLRLATELADVPFKHDAFNYGVHQLLVTW